MAIIKIIGYILLTLLILFILAVLLFLFSPISYEVKGKYHVNNTEELFLRVNWIFGLIRIRYNLETGLKSYCLWFDISDTDEEDKKKSKKRRKKVKKRVAGKKKTKETSVEPEVVKKSKKDIETMKKEIETESKEKQKKKAKKKEKKNEDSDEKSWIESGIEKIKVFFRKTIDKGKNIKKQVESIPKTWEKYEMSTVLEITKQFIKKLFKNIGIKKFSFEGVIGFEDPANTGQVIGIICAVFGFLGLPMVIQGNFTEEEIDIDGFIKGRSNIWKLFFPIIKYILNPKIKRIWNEF